MRSMRTRAAAIVGVTLVLTMAGCGGSPKAKTTPTPTAPTTGASSPTSTPSTPMTSPTATSTVLRSRATIGSILSLGVPAGWVVRRSAIYGGSGNVCLAPRSGSTAIFGCAGIAIYFGGRLPGAEMSPYAPDKEIGWYPATDVQECPFVPAASGAKFDGIKTLAGFEKGLKAVGSHKANWNRWKANCTDGKHPFHPQAWYLPTSKVVIFDYLEHPETAAVLASAKFASDGAEMSTYLSGHLVSATSSTIVVQPFKTYTTGAEGKAYAKAHGIEYPFLNDYYDADYGPKRTIVMNSSTACQGNVDLGKPVAGAPVACSAFTKADKDMPIGIWVLPGGSTAESVIEIFRP